MSFRLIEGPAGSGKTTALFLALAADLSSNPLQEGETVLAVTKVHGSRRRMEEKLESVLPRGTPRRCVTLNSFALHLVRRWYSLAQTLVPSMPHEEDFDGIATTCAKLIDHTSVRLWIRASYPLMIVDEMQDLKGSDLAIVKGLANDIRLLCAADSFQDLSGDSSCEATDWARSFASCTTLTVVRRTNAPALLEAARRLRSGGSLGRIVGAGLRVLGAPRAAVAASYLARNLTWWAGDVAVVSAARPSRSPWVADCIARLAAGPIGPKGKQCGPFKVAWEATGEEEMAGYEEEMGLNRTGTIYASDLLAKERSLPWPLIDWVRMQQRLCNRLTFSSKEIRMKLGHVQAMVRGFGTRSRQRVVALTIPQAKNREFENVVVLWPVVVGGGIESQTRNLYNAITRARRQCLLIVQDPVPQRSRLRQPPLG